MSKQKCTEQNRVLPVERSCAEVSGSSEVPRSAETLFFRLFKEVKLVRVCSIFKCLHVQVIASTKQQFLRNWRNFLGKNYIVIRT